ncbi:MAG: PIG-L family deacetylase [Deltaproteobacteria bacterium]|jgi:LmbE family N-acetylglucosaminyl deacetylase|nr:PIG-L family deacetylase [Deltaproteobacteria bacterium]
MNLVVVAHPDDEVLGFGATGAKLVDRGETVQVVILCGNVDVRTLRPTNEELYADIVAANQLLGFDVPVLGAFPNIRMNSVDHVDLVQFIEEQVLRFKPDRIFTHHPGDLNDDHLQVSRASMAASRLFQRRNDLTPLGSLHLMEISSSSDWAFPGAGNAFSPDTFEEVSDFIDLKIKALHCYRNVMRDFPHARSIEALKGLAAYRGGQCGLGYAEAFQTVFRTGV